MASEKAFAQRKAKFELNSRKELFREIAAIHDQGTYQYLVAYAELKVANAIYDAVRDIEFGETL